MGRAEESLLVESNVGLVSQIARNRFSSRMGDDDLIQSGMIGLWEAAQKWNGKTDFQPFARVCIYNNMLDYVRGLGATHNDTEELLEILEGDSDDWERLEDAEILERIGRAWPAGSREYMILSNLARGVDKRTVATRMGLKTYQVTRIAKRAMKRVQSGEK